MKVALCLYGKTGGTIGKDGKGELIDPKIAYDNYKKHILDKNDVDVFIHSWSIEVQNQILDMYKPKKSIIEPQRCFNVGVPAGHSIWRSHSRWYSNKKVLELKREYEISCGFEYDCVMVGRLDLMFFSDVIFDKYNMSLFHASHWNDSARKNNGWKANHQNHFLGQGFMDLWFFSNSKYMDEFGKLYDNLPKYDQTSPHIASYQHTRTFVPIDRIKYVMYRWFDYEIVRRKIYKSEL